MNPTTHTPVLLDEVIELLDIEPDDVVLDGTLGGGGHAGAMCEKLGENGVFIGIDQDAAAVERARAMLDHTSYTTSFHQDNFRNLDRVLEKENLSGVDKILFDLGLSSFQLEESGRGFSFQEDEPLAMTFEDSPSKETLTAERIANEWSEETLADIVYYYGGERFARRIARAIVAARQGSRIKTTRELAAIVLEATPEWYHAKRAHPATRTFQALRVAVNDEIESLREGLQKGLRALNPSGRFAVIAFHDVEDRVVKHFFRNAERDGEAHRLFKKPITPSRDEVIRNPRSRSAKLRAAEKREHRL